MSSVAEISFDLVMEDDMDFVEGTYRLAGGEWQVFIFSPSDSVDRPEPRFCRWPSGVSGVHVRWPRRTLALNRTTVLHTLNACLDWTEWREVEGPDSMVLR